MIKPWLNFFLYVVQRRSRKGRGAERRGNIPVRIYRIGNGNIEELRKCYCRFSAARTMDDDTSRSYELVVGSLPEVDLIDYCHEQRAH